MSSHWEEVYNVLAITQYYCGMKIILQEGARCMQEGPFTFWRWCAIIQKCQTQDWIWSTIYSIWSCWDTWQYQFWYPWTKSFQKIYGLYSLKHHIVEISPIRDDDERQVKIELLSFWSVRRWVSQLAKSQNWLKTHSKVINAQNKCLFHHFGGMLAWKSGLRF